MTDQYAFELYIGDRWAHRLEDPQGGGHLVPYPTVAAFGLAGEAGEVMELLKKHHRDGKHPGESLKLELGDLLHYLTVIARSYGWSLEDLMEANVTKLKARDAQRR